MHNARGQKRSSSASQENRRRHKKQLQQVPTPPPEPAQLPCSQPKSPNQGPSTPPPSSESLVGKKLSGELIKDAANAFFHSRVAKELEKIPRSDSGVVTNLRKRQEVAKKSSSSTEFRPRSVTVPKSPPAVLKSSSSSSSKAERKNSMQKKDRIKRSLTILPKSPERTRTPERSVCATMESATSMTAISDDDSTSKRYGKSEMKSKTSSLEITIESKPAQLLREFAARCRKVTVSELYHQYNSLPDPNKDECKAYLDAKHSTKNRYSNIYCLDRTRVDLQFLSHLPGYGRYIHANWVTHETLNQPVIVTQGPKKSSLCDFWRMVWQVRSQHIIMLCQYVEENRVKSNEYFVDEVGGCVSFGPLLVSTVAKAENEGITETTLKIAYEREERTVQHLLFPNWPDHQAPSTAHFHQLFLILHKMRGGQFPAVVHCSAGVGRSGTLVALEMCIMDLVNLKEINVPATVKKLRSYRCSAVQTFPQFMSLYLAILHFGRENGTLKESDMSHFSGLVEEYYRQLQ